MDKWEKSWKIFKNSFSVDTSQQPIYMMTRYRVGSIFATVAASYNLFLIRQKVLKNAIFLSRSKNPRIVKLMSIVVGSIYFSGLYVVWHIPSFFSQIAVRLYVSSEDAITNYLLSKHIENMILSDKRLKKAVRQDGFRI